MCGAGIGGLDITFVFLVIGNWGVVCGDGGRLGERLRELPKAKGVIGRSKRGQTCRSAGVPRVIEPKPLSDYGIDKHLADRAAAYGRAARPDERRAGDGARDAVPGAGEGWARQQEKGGERRGLVMSPVRRPRGAAYLRELAEAGDAVSSSCASRAGAWATQTRRCENGPVKRLLRRQPFRW